MLFLCIQEKLQETKNMLPVKDEVQILLLKLLSLSL